MRGEEYTSFPLPLRFGLYFLVSSSKITSCTCFQGRRLLCDPSQHGEGRHGTFRERSCHTPFTLLFFFSFFVSFLGALGNTALIETGRSTGDFIYPQTGGKVYSLRLRDNGNAYI